MAELVAQRRRELGLDPSGGPFDHAGPQEAVPTDGDMLEIALAYARRGWRVLPVWRPIGSGCSCRRKAACDRPGKHPRCRNGVKSATAEAERIRRWKWTTANIAIATGAESGLLVLDVDPRNGGDHTLAQLVERLGALPAGPVVATGGGGEHRYFAYPAGFDVGCPMLGPGVEIKAQGGYVVAPPSLHVSGRQYQWKIQPEGELHPLPTAWLEACNATCHIREHKRTQENKREHKRTKEVRRQGVRGHSRASHGGNGRFSFEEIIERTLPFREGTRHRMLFELARIIQANPSMRAADPQQFRMVVDRWFQRAKHKASVEGWTIRATPEENWWDFLEGWDRIQWPKGSFLMHVIEKAGTSMPQAAERYSSREIRLLVAVCRQLQERAGNKPFFLATSTAAQILAYHLPDGRLDRKRAWRILRGLVMDGVLEQVDAGNPKGRRAALFRYLGD